MEISEKAVLKPYIKEGLVNYEQLRSDHRIWTILNEIENMDPSGSSKKAQLSFWINAYNLVVLKSVVERLEKDPSWEGNITLWDKIKFFFIDRHLVAGRKMNLLTLENKILRRFGDPRIHFAINCGAISCPTLPPGIFDEDSIDSLLEFLTTEFINSEEITYDRESNSLIVSRIFKWYKKDFGGKDGIIEFINKYSHHQFPRNAKVVFNDYDWRLNSVSIIDGNTENNLKKLN